MYKILFKLRNKKQDDWLNRIKTKHQVKPIEETRSSLNAVGVTYKFGSFCNRILQKAAKHLVII